MLKVIGAFILLIIAINILGAIPVIGTLLAFLLLLVIAGIIVFHIIRNFSEIIFGIIVLIPHIILWTIFAVILAILFLWLY